MNPSTPEVIVELQLAIQPSSTIPNQPYLEKCVSCALVGANYLKDVEVTIRIVDSDEIQQLNRDYRHQDKPTNILSFPFEAPEGIELSLIGDLVICADIVAEETKQQQKTPKAHWTHMIIHGILHLLGYDHNEAKEAELMETLEIKLVKNLGFENPYLPKKG